MASDAAMVMEATMEPVAAETADNEISSWRTRDMVHQLLLQRGISAAQSTSAATPLSSHFDVDTCLARIRRDKAAVVRAAFGAAASTVLHQVLSEEQGEDDVPVASAPVPPLVQNWKHLEELRVTSLKRAHDNKEARKLKTTSEASPATKASAGTKKAAAAEAAKPKSSTAAFEGAQSSTAAKALTSRSPTPSAVGGQPLVPTIDSRSTVSRAVLCAATSIAFDMLTPAYPGHDVDVLDIPQNTSRKDGAGGTTSNSVEANASTATPTVNMGAVSLQAQTLGQRAASLAQNAARRSQQRNSYRRDNALYEQKKKRTHFQLSNPFAWKPDKSSGGDEMDDDEGDLVSEPEGLVHAPTDPSISLTEAWKNTCLPRLSAILQEGSGHAVYCDQDWTTRHGRVADLLRHLADDNNFGPHLIVTTTPQVEQFGKEFHGVNSHLRLISTSPDNEALRVLTYTGSKAQRRRLRRHFAHTNGLPNANFHVLVTSYSVFLQDYLHLCQVPYQVAMLDEGLLWLLSAHADPNGTIGALWSSGVWSSSDQHIGLAGTAHQDWDFCSSSPDESVKSACIGLTARHRIITAPSLTMRHRDTLHLAPVAGLVSFLLPQFADVVREEWDRSRIVTDPASMDHVRKLVSRSVVVHSSSNDGGHEDLYQLALNSMNGKVSAKLKQMDVSEKVPSVVPDESFVSAGKVSQSRRLALSWLGAPADSWLRYELGNTSFQPVLDAMKRSSSHGHVCEEVVTASSTTSSGAGGAVSGSQAYRLAVRCGRNFGSEQGLRQHMAALHAPPGTWLCRTCGGDCGTSQARTHHERSCGQPSGGTSGVQGNPLGGGVSTVGQGVRPGGGRQQNGPSGAVGKKGSAPSGVGAVGPEDKDKDGSFRVPGYRGVWVNPAGKHFIKVKGVPLKREEHEDKTETGEVLLFDTIEEAAQKHDEVATETGKDGELNFRPDGTRIVYEDSTPAAAAGRGLEMLGGGASSVVPALSVINIKDLPSGVKPLLRDPRATSRTGGNSKRHVYAYRGVCRQARKGHDRWQSQISFGGTNHYLGTFDSEWDAAAIYAWAHLILYGEEATKKAQKEGEEAAAAYEQEKKDIAAGKIVAPPPKPPKKKPPKKKEKKEPKKLQAAGADEKELASPSTKTAPEKEKDGSSRKKRPAKDSPPSEKKMKQTSKAVAKGDNASIAPILAKGVAKAPILLPRKTFKHIDDNDLGKMASQLILAARRHGYCISDPVLPPPIQQELRPCIPVSSSSSETPSGYAMLLGLSASLFAWTVQAFVSNCSFDSIEQADLAFAALSSEYKPEGVNERFRSVVQGSVCVIGRASIHMERASENLGLGAVPLGGTIGNIDANIGGETVSCSEAAAVIQKSSSGGSDFQFSATNDADVVTLNGQRVKAEMGSFPLFNEDVCTVGARVFVFLLPMDT